MKIKTMLGRICASLALTLGVSGAQASLIGDSVTVTNFFQGSLFQQATVVVTEPGVELIAFGGIWDINIGAESVAMSYSSSASFVSATGIDRYEFSGLEWGALAGAIQSLSNANNFSAGTGPSVSLLSPSSFAVEFTDWNRNNGTSVGVGITASHNVPVPAPLALLGVGLLGLAWRHRRR